MLRASMTLGSAGGCTERRARMPAPVRASTTTPSTEITTTVAATTRANTVPMAAAAPQASAPAIHPSHRNGDPLRFTPSLGPAMGPSLPAPANFGARGANVN